MRARRRQLHIRPPQKESQTLRREAPRAGAASHTRHRPRGALLSPRSGEGLSGFPRAPQGSCTRCCERLHRNSSNSSQAFSAWRHLLTACDAAHLRADILCRTPQPCSLPTERLCQPCVGHVSWQRLSSSNRSPGSSAPHSGNPHTISNFFLIVVPVIRDCDLTPVTLLGPANQVHVTRDLR